ncbi:hypothetical protein CDAR_513751 [Caerostris darwini]|uniref:Uncharacterized protein n=1 Tax=Caerostris darwini TaxID=1538125 RepID=A0AAV4MQS4_9ARAC|nr:hypothetical protein CDAR_513751 [Caerostris darwini]
MPAGDSWMTMDDARSSADLMNQMSRGHGGGASDRSSSKSICQGFRCRKSDFCCCVDLSDEISPFSWLSLFAANLKMSAGDIWMTMDDARSSADLMNQMSRGHGGGASGIFARFLFY